MNANLPPSHAMDPVGAGLASGVANVFQAYLGPPRQLQPVDPNEQRPVSTFNMPEAYYGKSKFLRSLVEDFSFTAHQKFFTEVLLPWELVDDIHIEWDMWTANAHLLGPTTHQAPSRQITQRRSVRRATLIRLGLSYEFEHDFIKTALGRRSFIIGIGQIARSVQETGNHEVIRACLEAHRYQQQYVREMGLIRRANFLEVLNEDRRNFFLWQKEKNGPAKWDADNDALLHAYQGQADSIMVPECMMIYATLVRPEVTDYYLRGQRGPDAVDNIRSPGTVGEMTTPVRRRLEPQVTLNEKDVYIVRPYHVENVANTEMLARVRQIGEYNIMTDEHVDYGKGAYESSHRDILIYNEDEDKFSRITLKMALDNCELFNADGSVKPLRQMDPNLSTLDANMVERDRRMDFLTKSDGTPVQYFGEINPVFFSSDDLHILSRTVMDSMSRDDPNGRAVVLQTISNVQSWVNGQAVVDFRGSAFTLDALLNHVYPGGVAPALSAEGTQARNVLNAFRTRLQSTLPLVHPAFNATDDKFFLNLLMAGRVPVVNGPPPAAGQPAANAPNTHIGSSAEENVHKAFLKTLVKGVPDSASGEVEKARDVATDATIGTPLERAQLIKDITLSTLPHSERPEWAQHGDYNTWYSEQIAMYKGQLARATALSASKTATPSVNIGWAVAGSDLPDNWHYVFPEHERVMTNVLGIGTDVPNSVSELPTARVVDALVRSARRSTYAGDADGPQYAQVGAGFGVSRNERIGAMNFGQNDADVQPSRVEGLRRDAHTLLRTRAHFGANLETAFGVTGSEVFAGGERHVVDINQWATNFLVKFIAFYFLHVQVKKAAFDAFIRHNVLFPMGFIIARPHATYRTRILIKLQSRGGAGKTYMGHSNAEIGHDVNRKIGLLHFTTYMAAVVDKPQNVFVQPDLYVDRYLGGLGVGFFNEVSYREVRLQGNNASIVVLPIPYAEKVIPNPMDISGRWYTASQYEMIDGATFERAHYSTHYRMNQIYKFYDQVNADEEFDMAWSHDSYVVLNRAMWRGMQWHNTPQSGKFDRVMPNTGHFGPDVYVGVKDVRNGATTYVEPQNWNSKFSVL